MIIYLDGSLGKYSDGQRTKIVLGWGLVIIDGDSHVEVAGSKKVRVDKIQDCELVAFIEAVLYADSHSADPKSVTFYADDERIGYMNYFLTANYTYPNPKIIDLMHRVKRIARDVYEMTTPEIIEVLVAKVEKYTLGSRFVKVKGHGRTIYNLRANDLAWHHMNRKRGVRKSLLPYDEWLNVGMVEWSQEQIPHLWNPPFTTGLQ